jgi:hypothetical protein
VLPVQFGGEPQVLRDVSEGVPGLPCASATSRSPSTALIPIAGSSPRAAVAWPALQCSTASSYRPVPTARATAAVVHEGMRRMVTPLLHAAHTELADR